MKLLIGGPGTGKTYNLIKQIEELKPSNFAFLSFTRQAANEAKQRLRPLYSPRALDNVRTIHSLAFKYLNTAKGQMFIHENLMDFGKQNGYEFSNRWRYEEDGTTEGLTDDDIVYRLLLIYHLLTTSEEVEEFALQHENEFYAIQDMAAKYKKYKYQKGLIDFNDLLWNALSKIDFPRFDLLCIDETQDLSPLQFKLIDKIASKSKEVIYAGDDDQMIYEWAGVRREYFMKLYSDCLPTDDIIKLDINHRIPDEVLSKANVIISRCKNHIEKFNQWISTTKYYNSLFFVSDFYSIDKFDPKKSYLILVRNKYLLHDIKLILDELGLPWEYLSNKSKECNIHFSTIHGAKGAEADHVILLTDVSPSTYDQINRDSEHRVWYVGVTRAKEQLTIVEPKGPTYYEL